MVLALNPVVLLISNKTQETGALDINWLQFFFAFGYSKNKEAILQENNCQIYNNKKNIIVRKF